MAKKWYSYFVVTDPAGASESAAPPETTPPPARAEDLAREPTAAPQPAAVSTVDLAAVYASAKIEVPPHGYTVLKVAEMLASEHLHTLAPDVKRKSILVALDAAGVPVNDVVSDAVRRDKALDTYERVLEQHVAEVRARVLAENQQIEQEIAQRVAEQRARIDENNRTVTADENEFLAWRARKQQEERTIAEAVAYFVTENPITTSAVAAPRQGESDVR